VFHTGSATVEILNPVRTLSEASRSVAIYCILKLVLVMMDVPAASVTVAATAKREHIYYRSVRGVGQHVSAVTTPLIFVIEFVKCVNIKTGNYH
jgi:hypothetical protein